MNGSVERHRIAGDQEEIHDDWTIKEMKRTEPESEWSARNPWKRLCPVVVVFRVDGLLSSSLLLSSGWCVFSSPVFLSPLVEREALPLDGKCPSLLLAERRRRNLSRTGATSSEDAAWPLAVAVHASLAAGDTHADKDGGW